MKKISIDLDDDVYSVLINNNKYDASDMLNLPPATVEKMKYFINNGTTETVVVKADGSGDEVVDTYIKQQQKSKQKLQDNLRITRGQVREHNRLENALETLASEIKSILIDNPPHKWTRKISNRTVSSSGNVGVIQLSDLHLNELCELSINTYDFDVASKRLEYLAKRSIKRFTDEGVDRVVVCMTGDTINSDRRIDEILNMATNRSKALMIASMLLEQFILDIAENFTVDVAVVTGNESRVRDTHAYSEMVVTDNYDWTIGQVLKLLFRSNNRVCFIDSENSRELVLNINGKNLLLMHGDTIGVSGVGKKILQVKQKMTSKYNIVIDYVIFGHIHEALCSSLYSRSGSLVGANSYSDDALQLESTASQNIYIFNTNYIEPCVIDLQTPIDVDGYYIEDTLVEYNVRKANPVVVTNIQSVG